MTVEELATLFEAHNDEYLKFARVPNKRSSRPDLHAFLLLDALVPGDRDIVSGAKHDQIFLDVDPDDLAKVVTEDVAVELVRCGVMYDEENDSLMMFA